MKNKTTIQPVLYSRKDKNNLHPVKIRITENRISSFINLGFSIEKRYWLKSTNRISSSHPNHLEYNFVINNKLQELDKIDNKKINLIKGKVNVFQDLEHKINNDFQNQYYSRKKFRTCNA